MQQTKTQKKKLKMTERTDSKKQKKRKEETKTRSAKEKMKKLATKKGDAPVAEREDEIEVEEEESEEDQEGGKEVEADLRENLEMISTPLRHTYDKVMVATFLNGRREETCAEMCLRAVADLGRKKIWVQVVEECEVVTRRWGGGTGWSWSERLESRSGLGGNNRIGLNPNTHRPNITPHKI